MLDISQFLEEQEDCMQTTLLNQLLHDEKHAPDVDLKDLVSMQSITDVDDDSLIDSIDDLGNLVDPMQVDQPVNTRVGDDSFYHIMLKLLHTMSSLEGMLFVQQISDAMSDLCMHNCEKGVDSIETKQKTLILRWVVDPAPSNFEQLPQDEKFARNIVIKLFNKKGKTQMTREAKKRKKKNRNGEGAEEGSSFTSWTNDQSLLVSGHFRILCAYNKFYNKHYPRSKRDEGRRQPNKIAYQPILCLLVEQVDFLDDVAESQCVVTLRNPLLELDDESFMMVDVNEVACICGVPSKVVVVD